MTNYISTPLSTLNADLNAIQSTLSSKADKSELANYAQLSDIPEVPEGDYLPLSGGTLSGRIYLKASQSQVVGSNAVLTASESATIYVGSWDESVELTANVTLSVMNAGQDFIDMISNSEEYTGDELTSYTVNAKIQFVGPNGLNKTLNGSATIGFGYHYVSDNSIDFGDSLDADLGHEDESALVFNELVFNRGSGGDNPTFVLRFNVDGDPYDSSQDDFGYSDIWTVEEIREEVETIEPFVLSSEIPEVSAFATETYVQEYVAEHGGGGTNISSLFSSEDYIPIDPFSDIDVDKVSVIDLGNKINQILQILKQDQQFPSIADPTKTYYKYNDGTLIEGTIANDMRSGYPSQKSISDCRQLKVGNNVTSAGIGSQIVSLTNLEMLILPNSLTAINNYAFSNFNLFSLTIPSSVESIGAGGIRYCYNLTSIVFLGSPSIGSEAFDKNSACSIYDFSKVTSIPDLQNVNAFSRTAADKKIIVPDALYDDWKAANNWNSSTNGIVDAITKASEA